RLTQQFTIYGIDLVRRTHPPYATVHHAEQQTAALPGLRQTDQLAQMFLPPQAHGLGDGALPSTQRERHALDLNHPTLLSLAEQDIAPAAASSPAATTALARALCTQASSPGAVSTSSQVPGSLRPGR